MGWSQWHQGWEQAPGGACLGAGSVKGAVSAHTCPCCRRNVARGSRRKSLMCRWARKHRETGRRPRHHTGTLSALASSRASWGALQPSVGAVGEAQGCSASHCSTALTPLSGRKQLKVSGCRRQRHLNAWVGSAAESSCGCSRLGVLQCGRVFAQVGSSVAVVVAAWNLPLYAVPALVAAMWTADVVTEDL
jgi:hypothetical protein